MLRRLGIRGKVLAALSVPVLVLFALAGTISMQSVEDVRVARTVNELLGSLGQARALSVALQAERDATMAFVLSDATTGPELRVQVDESRAEVNRAIGAAQQAATAIDLDSLDPVVERAVTGLEDQLGALESLRSVVDAGGVTMRNVFSGYSAVVERVTAFPSVVANALDDRRLATIINAQTQTMQLVEDYRQEQVLGRAVLDGARSNADVQELLRTIPATNVQQESTTLTVAQLELGDDVIVPPVRVGLQSYGNIRSIPLGGESTFLTFITSEQWYELAGEQAGEYAQLLRQLGDAAQDRADAVEGAAVRTAVLTISLTVLAVVVSLATALTIARQIVEPLRRLTAAAGQVRDELPRLVEQVSVPGQGPDLALARIPVDSRDEVGRLAEAFNEVNATTIQVAQEQAALRGSIAEMFVNVARRDQVLLNRQLSFIDALERSEEDPATLADLFRLDHLATRMRRNAESLLVLAGIDTGRRLREPIPVSDVIRTASSEIEHYERIHLDLPVDPLMLGHVALPAAHLLAELLENATVFSDPGTPVQVSTGIDETHVVVTVLDQGLGMTAAELAEANAKIRTTAASDVVGAQRLGLFVVGRIAGRLGAEVELGLGPDGTGTLASVRIPLILFVETSTIPLTAPVAAGAQRETETFAPVEEAAAVVHDTAFAPVPEHVQDVAAGRVGSAENPAEEVDLAALTDGQTGHGLPRRRSRGADAEAPAPSAGYRDLDDAAAAPSIPLAPRADALAGAATLPADDAWAPAVVEAQPLAVRRRADDVPAAPTPAETPADAPDAPAPLPTRAVADLPVRAPSATGLPVRNPAEPVLPAEAGPAPVDPPESRAAMFSGFRSRRAELAAAAVDQVTDGDATSGDGADRLAAAATHRGDAPAVEPAPEPLVIPALEEDEEYPPSLLGAVEERPGGRHAHDEEPTWPPAVEGAEDAWGAPDAADEPVWSESDAWSRSASWSAPVAQPEPVPAGPGASWEPRPAESDEQTRQEWAQQEQAQQEQVQQEPVQQGWAPQTTWSAEAEPATPADTPAPAAAWDAQPWQAPAWPAAADVATQAATPEPTPWSPVGDGPAVEADAVAAEPAPVPAAAAVEHGAPEAQQEAGPGAADVAPAKRRWWPFGRAKRAATTPVVATVDTAPAPAPSDAVDAGTALPALPVPGAPVQAPAVAVEGSVTPPFAPVRASAWGPSEGGAHALPETGAVEPVEPDAPLTPVDTPIPQRAGATAFFPAVHATRDAHPADQPDDLGTPTPGSAPVSGWDVPSPHGMPPQPVAPAPVATPTPEPAAWAPQAWDEPEQPVWQPTAAPQATTAPPAAPAGPLGHRTPGATQQSFTPEPLPAFAPGPTTFTPEPLPAFPPGPTTFTPEPAGASGFDAEVNTMLAQRADLAQQALAELSQLSTYRPQTVAGGTGSLTRRTPSAVPAAPEIATRPSGQRLERDANQVRSLLSSFQSGTSRGRQAVDGPQTTGAGTPGAGAEDGPHEAEGDQLAPVPTDSDLTQRSTSW